MKIVINNVRAQDNNTTEIILQHNAKWAFLLSEFKTFFRLGLAGG